MITGTNPYSAGALYSSPLSKDKASGQNILGKVSQEEKIAKAGFKAYIRDIQTEKLEEKTRQNALLKFNLTEEKLEKIGAVSPQKLGILEANIQEYITDYLQKQVKNELIKEAHDQGKEGYRQGSLIDLKV